MPMSAVNAYSLSAEADAQNLGLVWFTRKTAWRAVLKNVWGFMRLMALAGHEMKPTRSLIIEFEKKMPIQLDGDLVSFKTKILNINLVEEPLQVLKINRPLDRD
jgi:hypothetical protein